jgi:hypothetical protein
MDDRSSVPPLLSPAFLSQCLTVRLLQRIMRVRCTFSCGQVARALNCGLPLLFLLQAYQHDKINVVTVDAALGSLAVRSHPGAAAVGVKPALPSAVLSQVCLCVCQCMNLLVVFPRMH